MVKPVFVLWGTSTYLAVQMWHTLRKKNAWPFCAYDMFNYYVLERRYQLRIALYDARGRVTGPLDPWGVLPLEFFRVVSILEMVYFSNQKDEVKKDFSERTLRRANRTSWEDFDEVRAVVRSASGAPFVAFDLYLVEVDSERCDPVDRASVLSTELVYRHDPDGVVSDSALRWALVDEVIN